VRCEDVFCPLLTPLLVSMSLSPELPGCRACYVEQNTTSTCCFPQDATCLADLCSRSPSCTIEDIIRKHRVDSSCRQPDTVTRRPEMRSDADGQTSWRLRVFRSVRTGYSDTDAGRQAGRQAGWPCFAFCMVRQTPANGHRRSPSRPRCRNPKSSCRALLAARHRPA
jgi:hypothetical protein